MATELTLQNDMASPSFVAADATGNTFDNSSGLVYLWVKNGGGLTRTITIAEQRTCSFGHTAQDFTATVDAGVTATLGPFDIMRFNSSQKIVTVTYSDINSVTVAAVKG